MVLCCLLNNSEASLDDYDSKSVFPGEFLLGMISSEDREVRFCEIKDTHSAVLCPQRLPSELGAFYKHCCVSNDARGSW